MISIPHELIAAIVDELQTDWDTLKSCALVSSAFCPPSQRHLFHSLWLHRENWKYFPPLETGVTVPAGTIKGAFRLLSESPHLAAYVRDLTIDLPDHSADENRPLAHVLRSAQNLERFVFCGRARSWGNIPAPLVEALLEVFARPSLRGLHFLHLHRIPPAVVDRALESVRVLSFHSTSAFASASTSSEEGNEDSDDDTELQDESRPASGRTSILEELILSRTRPSIHTRIPSPHAPPLTKLRKLCFWSIDSLASDRLLRSSAGTLRDLEIECGVLSSPLHLRLPALSSLKSLQSLKLHMFCGFNHRLPEGFAQTLADLPPISSLHLVFTVNDSVAPDVWIHEVGPLPGFPPHPHTHTEVGYQGKITVHCQLVFCSFPDKGSDRDSLFSSFCEGIGLAFSGLEVKFERVDDWLGLIARLPL